MSRFANIETLKRTDDWSLFQTDASAKVLRAFLDSLITAEDYKGVYATIKDLEYVLRDGFFRPAIYPLCCASALIRWRCSTGTAMTSDWIPDGVKNPGAPDGSGRRIPGYGRPAPWPNVAKHCGYGRGRPWLLKLTTPTCLDRRSSPLSAAPVGRLLR